MEAIGTGASLLALLETTVVLARKTRELYKAIQGAPAEINHVSNRLSLVQGIIHEILNLTPDSSDILDVLVPSHLRLILADALEQTSAPIRQIHNAYSHHRAGPVKRSGRIRWALLERNTVQMSLGQLHDAENSLGLAVQLLQLYEVYSNLCIKLTVIENRTRRLQSVSHTSVARIRTAQSLFNNQVTALNVNMQNLSQSHQCRIKEIEDDERDSLDSAGQDNSDNRTHPIRKFGFKKQSAHGRHAVGKRAEMGTIMALPALRISGSLWTYWDEHQSTYSISLKYQLPSVFGHRALHLELKLRRYAMSMFQTSLLHGNLSVINYIPRNSEIVFACRGGDEGAVRELFRNRKASPNDCFERESGSSWSLLRAALYSNNLGLVKFLLDTGANPNYANGTCHASLLQTALQTCSIDICRLLLARGASTEHLDKYGRDLAWYLPTWVPPSNSGRQSFHGYSKVTDEAIDFLFGCSFDGWSSLDRYGCSFFDRAVRLYSKNDTNLLSRYEGKIIPSPQTRLTPLRMATPMWNGAVISLLLQLGNEVDLASNSGTPLHRVILDWSAGSIEKTKNEQLLTTMKPHLGRGKYVNVGRPGDNMTPLMLAAWCGVSEEVIVMLLGHGADVHALCNRGHTALYYSQQHVEWAPQNVLQLLKHGCDPHASGMRLKSFIKRATMETPLGRMAEELKRLGLRKRRLYAARSTDIYCQKFPDLYFDGEDVFWDAEQDIVPGYGSQYDYNLVDKA